VSAPLSDPLNSWLHEVQEKIENGWLPQKLEQFTPVITEDWEFLDSPFGRHGVYTDYDEEGDEFVYVGFVITQSQIFAEDNNGTYFHLNNFRIYTGRNEEDIPAEQETVPT